MVYSNICLTL
jgi:Ca2+-binding EF-hand superfamily protein